MSVRLPTHVGPCVIVVGARLQEVEEITHLLLQVKKASLVTYGIIAELVSSPPAGDVRAFVLASDDAAETIGRALHWLRYRHPRSVLAVVADSGDHGTERLARAGSALYLPRPVELAQWMGVLESSLAGSNASPARTPSPNS